MRTEVPIKAEVRCDDGVAGTSEAVILDPLKREITHLVLRERHYPHTERLVPVGCDSNCPRSLRSSST